MSDLSQSTLNEPPQFSLKPEADQHHVICVDNNDDDSSWALAWKNITVTVQGHEPKLLLDNVSGRIGPGEMVAIMGPR